MTELYESWEADASLGQILAGLGLAKLPPASQLLIEKSVMEPYEHHREKSRLAKTLNIKTATVTAALVALNNALVSQQWHSVRYALDPQAVERDGHRHGNDRGTRGTK